MSLNYKSLIDLNMNSGFILHPLLNANGFSDVSSSGLI
jgi:hypothetical protein